MAAENMDRIAREINQLTDIELDNLGEMVTILQAYRKESEASSSPIPCVETQELPSASAEELTKNVTSGGSPISSKSGKKSGSVESKIINGCGPYLYLRFWSGGVHRSQYMGKKFMG